MAQGKTKSPDGVWAFANYTTVVFTILRLTGDLDWAWWWILSPTWGIFALLFMFGLMKGILDEPL